MANPKGNPANLTGGSRKGVPNKTTTLAKEAIAKAFDKLGGVEGLVKWAEADDDNRKVFYATIWPKIIPVQTELTGRDGAAIQFEQRQKEDVDVVTGAIAGLVARAGAARVDGSTHH